MIEQYILKKPYTVRKLILRDGIYSYKFYTTNILDCIEEHRSRFLTSFGFSPVIRKVSSYSTYCSQYWGWSILSGTALYWDYKILCKYQFQILDGYGNIVDPKIFWDAYILQHGNFDNQHRYQRIADTGNARTPRPGRSKNPKTVQKHKYHKDYKNVERELRNEGIYVRGASRDTRVIDYDFLDWDLKKRTTDINWKRQRKTQYKQKEGLKPSF